VVALDAAPASYTHQHSKVFGAMSALQALPNHSPAALSADSAALLRDGTHFVFDDAARLQPVDVTQDDADGALALLLKDEAYGGPATNRLRALAHRWLGMKLLGHGIARAERELLLNGLLLWNRGYAAESQSSEISDAEAEAAFAWRWAVNVERLKITEHNIHGWPLASGETVAGASPTGAAAAGGTLLDWTPSSWAALFIGGKRSTRLTTPRYLASIPPAFPQHRLHMVDAHHFVQHEQPQSVATEIANFVSEQTVRK
jgi:pimeloyl-ACP methyl ester carboxylesterase